MSAEGEAGSGLVWRARPASDEDAPADRADLHPSDRGRASSIAHPAVQARFVVGRALLRETVGALRPDLDADAIAVVVEPSGRLRIAGHDELHVSVSHTRGLAVAVASAVGPVGIDVEPLERDDLPPVRVWLTAEERRRSDDLAPVDRQPWLLHLWVAKEAVIKAYPCGGPVPRSAVEVDTDGGVATGPVTARLRCHTVDDHFLIVVAIA